MRAARPSQPLVDRRDDRGDFVADGEFVVSSRDGPVPLEAVDSAFDSVAFATVGLVRWPAAAHATLLSVADLVGLLRDGAADAASAQVGAVRARAVRPIRADLVGLGARASRTDARDTDAVEHILELRAVMAVASGDDQGQRFLPLFDREMELRRQSAPGASESMVGRFGVDAAGRFSLESPLFRAPAACWCARAMVESTLTSQVISPSASARAWSCLRIRFQVPSRCQRRNNP